MRVKPIYLVLAATVVSLVPMPIALATAHAPSAIGSAAVANLHAQASLKSLQKQIVSLNRRIAALEHSGRKPFGLAGGSLVGSYPNPTIAAGAVARPQLANDAVASAQIANGSVFSQDIANGAVELSKLALNSVGSAALIDGSVGRADLANAAVDQTKLASNSVGSSVLIDGSVGRADLANGVIDQSKLDNGSVGSPNLIDGSVGRAQLMKGAVTADRLAPVFPITSGQGDVINPGQTRASTVTCPQGNRILSGGFEWAATNHDGASVISSGPAFNGDPSTQWAVQARVDSGGQANTLIVEALCISG